MKSLLNETIQNYEQTLSKEEKKEFKKSKKLIKQVKMIRDDSRVEDDGSKRPSGLAFIELETAPLALFISRRLNNLILRKGSKRGIIVDFAVQDARKLRKREMKLDA